jgi:hypothetical protein
MVASLVLLLPLLLLAQLCRADCTSGAARVLFVCHDAGESLGLLPVARRLAAGGTAVCVLALGQPATTIFAAEPFTVTPAQVGIRTAVIDGDAGRHQTLPPADVARFRAFFATAGAGRGLRVVVPGMVYAMQSQLAGAVLHHAGSAVASLAFDDSFALWNAASLPAQLFVNEAAARRNASVVMVTARSVAAAIVAQTNGTLLAATTGTPTLGTWHAVAANVSLKARVDAAVWRKQGPGVVRAVIVGGYGPGSKAALAVICAAARQLGGNVSWVFSPHPGYPPAPQAAWFAAWGCGAPLIRSIGVGDLAGAADIDTSALVVTSNFSVSQGSTCGGQAIAVGKPHGYVSATYHDVFTAAGVIPNVPSARAVVAAVLGPWRRERYSVSPEDVTAVGIPLDALQRVLRQIRRHL